LKIKKEKIMVSLNSGTNPSTIGDRLRLAREMAGLSQAQVAKMLDLHRPSISEMEAGRRKISSDELITISQIYNVSVSWLTRAQEEETGKFQDRVELAARELSKLKPEDLDRVLQLLSALRTKEDG
jgi:transcriptional regulator with XRE-family HTH domain